MFEAPTLVLLIRQKGGKIKMFLIIHYPFFDVIQSQQTGKIDRETIEDNSR